MPSEKRARQRAAREAKKIAEAKRRRRRILARNALVVVVVGGIIAAIALTATGGGSKKPPAKSSSKTTTTLKGKAAKGGTTTTAAGGSTTTSTTAPSAGTIGKEQKAANAAAVAAGCPKSPTQRVNTLTWATPPAMSITPTKTYTATIKTTAGTITITLQAKAAPNTVNNFVFLAKQGYYKCVIFHRVIPGFMDQTGDPTGTGTGSPGYHFANENVPTSYATGEVAMANSGGTDSDGAQFFIVATGGATQLNQDLAGGDKYTVFGTVTSGMTVVEKINAEGKPGTGTPPKVIQRMLSVTIATS